MKKLVLIFVVPLVFIACNSGSGKGPSDGTDTTTKVADASEAAILTFEKTEYDFGMINEGDKVNYDYKFTNTGKTPLIISDAQASCGCTIPEFPKAPVAPGKGGVIKVVFNSAGKFGKQTKAITITSNAVPPTTVVYLNGEVKEQNTTKK